MVFWWFQTVTNVTQSSVVKDFQRSELFPSDFKPFESAYKTQVNMLIFLFQLAKILNRVCHFFIQNRCPICIEYRIKYIWMYSF